MTVKVNSDGDFVENVHNNLESNVVSASYDILNKSELSVGTLAHEVRKALSEASDGDSDIAKWCDAVTSVQVAERTDESDGTLGRMFWKATDYSAGEYNKLLPSQKYDSIATAELGETELSHQKDELVNAGIVSDDQTVLVPQTNDGDIVPIIAVSNDRDEAHPTFEEAKKTLDKFVSDYFGEVDIDETAETNDESSDEQEDSSSDSDIGVNDPTQIDGIGSSTVEKIESNGFEITPSLNVSEHIEVEPFGFEDDSPEDGTVEMPSPSEVKDLMDEGWTKEEIQDFYGA
jgi:hypothetical protein